jgi:hypothetical protein
MLSSQHAIIVRSEAQHYAIMVCLYFTGSPTSQPLNGPNPIDAHVPEIWKNLEQTKTVHYSICGQPVKPGRFGLLSKCLQRDINPGNPKENTMTVVYANGQENLNDYSDFHKIETNAEGIAFRCIPGKVMDENIMENSVFIKNSNLISELFSNNPQYEVLPKIPLDNEFKKSILDDINRQSGTEGANVAINETTEKKKKAENDKRGRKKKTLTNTSVPTGASVEIKKKENRR